MKVSFFKTSFGNPAIHFEFNAFSTAHLPSKDPGIMDSAVIEAIHEDISSVTSILVSFASSCGNSTAEYPMDMPQIYIPKSGNIAAQT